MSHWIGDVFTSNYGWSHLETLVDLPPRMAGWRGERLAAEETRDALIEAGCRGVEIREFSVPKWVRGSSSLETRCGGEDCIALPYSPSGSVSGRLVDVGYGTPEEFEKADLDGCVALASSTVPHEYPRFIHRREKYHRAVDAGAVAFVYTNHIDGCLVPTGKIGRGGIGEIPALGVTKEVGARLRRRSLGGEVEVGVEADTGDTGEATSRNVVARLGKDTDERVLLTSHIDAHDVGEGAADNGMGTAMVVETANVLADRESDLGCCIEFVCFGAEEVGLLGSHRHSREIDRGDVKAVINLDGVARSRDLKIYTNGFHEFDEVVDGVSEKFDHPVRKLDAVDPHSDHWPFVEKGMPAVYVKSVTEGRDRGWGHTPADTIDKLDIRDLRHQTVLVAELIKEVASSDFSVEHRPVEWVKERLERDNEAEAMKVTGEWRFD